MSESEAATYQQQPLSATWHQYQWMLRLTCIVASLALIEIISVQFNGPGCFSLTAVFVASALSSIAGFAFSAICGAILFHLPETPVHVVQVMLTCSIAIQLYSVLSLRNAVDWRYLRRFLCGGMIGLPLGIYLLTHLSTHLYLKCIGAFLVGYGLLMLLRRTPQRRFTSIAGDYIAGFLGGVTGGFVAFPGALVTVWCGLQGWTKERQRGIYQPFILIMQVAALAMISVISAASAKGVGLDVSTVSYVPGALLGTWCGIAIFRRLTDLQFNRTVYSLLIVSGVGLLA
jgi:uncharacterized protein